QGMMFGYATNETDSYMPLALELAHSLLMELAAIRKRGEEMPYLRPDSKSQVTISYSDDNVPEYIDTIVVSTQHDEFLDDDKAMQRQIEKDVREVLIPRVKAGLRPDVQRLFDHDFKLHVNPTGI